jgi:hypothetical protein
MKICKKCQHKLLESDFYFNKSQNRYLSYCKKCENIRNKQYRINNKDKVKIRKHNNFLIHKKDPNYIKRKKQWNVNNKDKIKIYNKKTQLKYKDKIRISKNKYIKNKYHTNINYKLLQNLRRRSLLALHGVCKSTKTINLIMCSIQELKLHIEKQWLPGMSWNNYGLGNNKWNIDHIIPCNFFKDYILDPVEQYMCFRYQNLQPLWSNDNIKKSNKI